MPDPFILRILLFLWDSDFLMAPKTMPTAAATAPLPPPPSDKALSTFVLVRLDAETKTVIENDKSSLNLKRQDDDATLVLWDTTTGAKMVLRPCGNRLVGQPAVRAATQTAVGSVAAHVTTVPIPGVKN